ncbi:MAG TPA: glycosyltransferase [Solirubrobacteraceae bacterium]|nr:glycosyltransferase [Solirubrobacteraceae bacterium]
MAGLRRRLGSISGTVEDVRDRVNGLELELADLRRENARHREILLALRDREPEQRERLAQLRRSTDYELAFTESEPLVSVIIPTYDNYERLADRSIPSVQAQTWQHFEVLVVGDAAPDAARTVVESIGDERVRFWNRTYRGPYPEDPRDRWHIAGVPPYNEAAATARGRWIAHLGDDDALRPHHLEVLLDRARQDRLELCYGIANTYRPDGSVAPLVGRFPPEWGQFSFQATIYHAGLAPIFPAEMSDALFQMPWDWGLCRRMMRAGVRMGMVDSIVADGYPSALWIGREGASSV